MNKQGLNVKLFMTGARLFYFTVLSFVRELSLIVIYKLPYLNRFTITYYAYFFHEGRAHIAS